MDSEQHKSHFHVLGMSCVNCARRVEKSLQQLEGVRYASVNVATNTAFLVAERPVAFAEIVRSVDEAGYRAVQEVDVDFEAQRYAAARRNLAIAWALTVPLMVGMLVIMLGPGGGHAAHGATAGWRGAFPWLELVFGTVLFATAGRATLRGAWIALRHGHSNMDTLVAIGAIASLLTSALNLLGPGEGRFGLLPVAILPFGTIGAMIIALHLTGRYLESRLRDRAAKEIKGLLKLQAHTARVVGEPLVGGAAGELSELLVPIDAVKADAQVRILPGERIPVDGRVLSGSSAVDESLITGESLPVRKGEGGEVTGGSMNLTGVLTVRVTRVGGDTFLAQMIQLIQEVQGGKVPIQALADRVTRIFVPAIITLALLGGLAWTFLHSWLAPLNRFAQAYLPWAVAAEDPVSLGIFVFVTTILIACPCSLGLATPMALVRGTALAARRGLIIRNAEAIQTAREVGVAVLDKTGTLTRGEPHIVAHTLDPHELGIVAAIEAGSNHPLARAIAPFAAPPGQRPTVSDLEELAGEGVRATVDGQRWSIGRPTDPHRWADWIEAGRTVVEVRRDGELRGALAAEDPLRDDAPAAVAGLVRLGVRPVMATGDAEGTARAIAARLGITTVHAGVRPAGKLDLVRAYQAEGRRTAMVGDGINDAAALKGADLGVALGSGTDLAIDTADVVVVRGGVGQLVDLLQISRRTFAIIRQNLFWAFAYNVVAIPLALLGLLHPLVAEAAMLLSSITVILNALRIREGAGGVAK